MTQSASKKPTDAQIRHSLEQILSSEEFRRSRRMCSLLEYLVAESLAGQGNKIKATSIAIDVFGRDATFDQQNDTIVRVEAGRLRVRLGDYYSGAGNKDPLVIEIPKGAYLPKFSLRPSAGTDTTESSSIPVADSGAGSKPSTWFAFAAGLVVAVLIFATTTLVMNRNGVTPSSERSSNYNLPAVESKPYLVVNTVAAKPGDAQTELIAAGLVEALITNLSKLSGLSVMAHASVLKIHQRGDPLNLTDLRSQFGATHLLRGTIERDNDLVIINVQLVDAKTARIVWAERMSRSLHKIIDLEEDLALTLAQKLAVQLQPSERARLSQYHATSSEAWLLYRQGLITIMPPRDLARVQAARGLFDRAYEIDPSFAGGYAGHSFAHSTRVLFMNTPNPEQDLASALELAEKAIELDPNFGAGYAMLAFAQALSGDAELAVQSARKSEGIQPGDAFSQFIMGMSLIIAKKSHLSIPHLEEALRLDPLESRMPYLNVMGIGYYAASDYSNAVTIIEQNFARGGPRGPHMDVFVAAAYAQLGETQRAEEIVSKMLQKYPDFRYQPWVELWITEPAHQSQTLGLLQDAGLNLLGI